MYSTPRTVSRLVLPYLLRGAKLAKPVRVNVIRLLISERLNQIWAGRLRTEYYVTQVLNISSRYRKTLQATLILPIHVRAKMSRFFTQGDSSSESSSSDEEELYSEEEGVQKSDEESSDEEGASDEEGSSSSSDEGGKSGVSKFLRDVASSDESEDEDKVTVVKSAKDKRLEELEGVVKIIDNASKIGDWSAIATGQPK